MKIKKLQNVPASLLAGSNAKNTLKYFLIAPEEWKLSSLVALIMEKKKRPKNNQATVPIASSNELTTFMYCMLA